MNRETNGDKPERVDLQSSDLIAKNLEALKDTFPDLLVDGAINAGRLAELTGLEVTGGLVTTSSYGLQWAGKGLAIESLSMPARGSLDPETNLDKEFAEAPHVLIEADNLEALKLLQKSYNDQVDLIYIDPPYNTGNDFVYPDDFRDGLSQYLTVTGQTDDSGNRVSAVVETSGRKHSQWLSMIYPRLVAGRNLLTQRGAIYLSIDTNEVGQLRLLLDEIFGPENFVAEIAVSLNPKGRQLSSHFATSHEYLLVYARNIGECALEASSTTLVDVADFPLSEPDGLKYRRLPLRNTNHKFTSTTNPTLHYPIYGDPLTGEVSGSAFEGAVPVLPRFGDGQPAVWRWSLPLVNERSTELTCREVNGKTGKRIDIFQKDYLTKDRRKKLNSVWLSDQVGSTDSAVAELKKLVGPVFQSPKPVKLLRRILETMPDDSVVLDYFAGSGTTAHAVLAANRDDGGTRKSISINLPEATPDDSEARKRGYDTVFSITRARIAAARDELGKPDGSAHRVFRLGPSNFEAKRSQLNEQSTLLEESTLSSDHGSLDSIAAEIFLNEGVRLDEPWTCHSFEDADAIASGQVVFLASFALTTELITAAIGLAPRVLILLEDALAGRDSLKANTFFACQQVGITMKTV